VVVSLVRDRLLPAWPASKTLTLCKILCQARCSTVVLSWAGGAND